MAAKEAHGAGHGAAAPVLGKDNVDVDTKAIRQLVIIGSGPRCALTRVSICSPLRARFTLTL
jgi:hypothetical protein